MMRFAGLTICIGLAIAGIIWSASGDDLPPLLVSARSLPPGIDRCAECHADLVERFRSAPHHNTLTQPVGAELERFAGHESASPGDRGHVRFVERAGDLWAESLPGRDEPGASRDELKIDWIFGSGRHAQTPVSVLTGPDGRLELIEHGVSWYPESGLGKTLSLSESSDEAHGLLSFGNHHGPSAAQECFSCHASHLGDSGAALRPSQSPHDVVTGVGCIRCHVRAADHMTTVDEGTLSLDRWSELTPLESINRCGECHRRADHFTPDELVPENQTLARFAPVGLSLSACFTQQSRSGRLDCLTCHDPHAVSRADQNVFREACLRCHTGTQGETAMCSVQPPESACIGCHMPKIPVNDQLSFTDHWIRIRPPTGSR